jgi:hypothetical protein
MKRSAELLVLVALVTACSDSAVTTARIRPPKAVDNAVAAVGPSVSQDLATLRSVTAAFHDFHVAARSGWSAQITPCMVDPAGAGGMGFHYGNTALIDGSVQVDKPQLLLYEPEKNGDLRLVAVEYIVPYVFHSRESEPPVLFGQAFQRNDVFQLWGLHAWVWKENPSGMFANWNPAVNCANATSVMSMSH